MWRRCTRWRGGPPLALQIRVDGERLAVGPVEDDGHDLSVRATLGALIAQLPFRRRDDAPPVGKVGIEGDADLACRLQRLAERSAEATKQIAAIVKTIQTDTQDAVGAMENATRNVVEGAQLSDAAGQALAEIGEVSTETARLIERISADTQDQAATAGRVAATMKDILAVTEQTSLGTRQTAVSIGQLAELAVELKGSVSGFKV